MELVVVGFQDKYRAAQLLAELRQRGVHLFETDRAITVSWEDRQNFIVQQSINLSRQEGARWARLWAGFIKATLFQPFTEQLSEAAVNMASRENQNTDHELMTALNRNWWLSDVGIPDDFVRDVGAIVQPGESAIITLVEKFDPDIAVSVLRDSGGSLLYKSLTDEQVSKVRQVLASGD